jgi:hypothetical protein
MVVANYVKPARLFISLVGAMQLLATAACAHLQNRGTDAITIDKNSRC